MKYTYTHHDHIRWMSVWIFKYIREFKICKENKKKLLTLAMSIFYLCDPGALQRCSSMYLLFEIILLKNSKKYAV